MSKMISAAAAGLVATAIVSLAPAAHADEQGYISELQSEGLPAGPGLFMTMGYETCNWLRGGMPVSTAENNFGLMSGAVGPQVVAAAQHNLCPDTLKK